MLITLNAEWDSSVDYCKEYFKVYERLDYDWNSFYGWDVVRVLDFIVDRKLTKISKFLFGFLRSMISHSRKRKLFELHRKLVVQLSKEFNEAVPECILEKYTELE